MCLSQRLAFLVGRLRAGQPELIMGVWGPGVKAEERQSRVEA